jgi:hypothetical protein
MYLVLIEGAISALIKNSVPHLMLSTQGLGRSVGPRSDLFSPQVLNQEMSVTSCLKAAASLSLETVVEFLVPFCFQTLPTTGVYDLGLYP